MSILKSESLLNRTDVNWSKDSIFFANKIEDIQLFSTLGDFDTTSQRKNEVFDLFIKYQKFDEMILDTIIDIQERVEAVGEVTPRLSAQLEILRFVRNTVLSQRQDQGRIDEKEHLLSMNKKGNS